MTDDHHDEGLAYDVGTILTRRRMLGLAVGAGAAAFLAACGGDDSGAASASTTATPSTQPSAQPSGGLGGPPPGGAPPGGAGSAAAATTNADTGLSAVPEETAGPFPGDGSNGANALNQSGIVRSDIRSSFGSASGTADGVPIDLEMTIVDVATNKAVEGAAVYVWHCDAEGRYSMYSDGVTDENYLRGVQVTDASGLVKFTSVYPACYSGRWPHIHYEVYPNVDAITSASNKVATSQLALPDEVNTAVYATSHYDGSEANYSQISLSTDMVFSDGTTNEVPTVSGSVSSGFTVAIKSPVAF
jgi:protocatechuate 3,4-dioxygenase beta subunit